MINWLFFYLAITLFLLLVGVLVLWVALGKMQFRERIAIVALLAGLIATAVVTLWMSSQ